MNDGRLVADLHKDLACFELRRDNAMRIASESTSPRSKRYWHAQAAYNERLAGNQLRLITALQTGGSEALYAEILMQSGQATGLLLALIVAWGGDYAAPA